MSFDDGKTVAKCSISILEVENDDEKRWKATLIYP